LSIENRVLKGPRPTTERQRSDRLRDAELGTRSGEFENNLMTMKRMTASGLMIHDH